MQRLDALLEESGCRALLILSASSSDPAVAPFAGEGRLAPCLALVPKGGTPRLGFLNPMERTEAARAPTALLDPQTLEVARWSRDGAVGVDLWLPVVQRALQLCELAPGRVALAGSLSAGVVEATCRGLAEWGWNFVPGETFSALLRKRKTPDVLREVRRAADGACAALRAVATRLAEAEVRADGWLRSRGEAVTVGHLRAEIARVLAGHGLSQPEQGIVVPAEEGAVPHSLGTDTRRLRAGDSLVVDIFPKGHAFADCTRTLCVGEPGPQLRDGHALVMSAVELAEAHARVGVLGFDLQRRVCEHFRRHGWPTAQHNPGTERGYVHGLGHGVGFELHELPSFREHAPEREGILEDGDVITLEPGLYEPADGWAVRLEDTYLVTEHGLETLTPLPRTLDPRQW